MALKAGDEVKFSQSHPEFRVFSTTASLKLGL